MEHKKKKNRQIKQIRKVNPERRRGKRILHPLPISSVLCFPLAQPCFFFNCLIIHLQALIYPPLLGLYVQPLCETFSWISNELLAYKFSLPGKAPIYGRVCFSSTFNPLGEKRPYADFFKSGPRNVLGQEVTQLESVWCLSDSYGDNTGQLIFFYH